MAPCKSTAEQVSFEWLHHRVSSTDSKVRTTLHVSITDSGSDKVKETVSVILGIKIRKRWVLGGRVVHHKRLLTA